MKKKLESKEAKFKEAIEAISAENAKLSEEKSQLEKDSNYLKDELKGSQDQLGEKEAELNSI